MTLTQNGKDNIARTFGISNCYVSTGLSWIYLGLDGISHNESGSTSQIVSRLVMSSIVISVTFNSIEYTYGQLKIMNDNTDVTLTDAQWIALNDGSPVGEAKYCFTCPPVGCGFSVLSTLQRQRIFNMK